MISNKGFIKESLLFGKIERSQEKFLNFRKRQMSLKEEEKKKSEQMKHLTLIEIEKVRKETELSVMN